MRLADLPLDLLRFSLQYLSLIEVATFDLAILNRDFRHHFLSAIAGLELLDINFYLSSELIHWIMSRGVLVRDIPITNDDAHLLDLIEYSQDTLRSINLSHSRIFEEVMIPFLNDCPNLVSINFRSYSELTDSGVAFLCQSKRNLLQLNLSGCPQLTSASIITIAECCPQLQDLNLSSLHFVTDEEVGWIIQGCSKLRKINLSSTEITTATVEAIVQSYPKLQSLSFLKCQRVSDEASRLLVSRVFYRLVMNSEDPIDQLNGTLQLGNYFATAPRFLDCISLPHLIARLLTFLSPNGLPELQVEVCEILCALPTLSRCDPTGSELLGRSGAIPPLLKLLSSPHPEVVQHAAQVIRLCTRHVGFSDIAATLPADAITQLLSLCKRHPARPDLFLSVLLTLLQILPADSLLPTLPSLLPLLDESTPQSLSKSCRALKIFLSAGEQPVRQAILDLGFLPRILTLLRVDQPDALFVHEAFEVLETCITRCGNPVVLALSQDIFETIRRLLSAPGEGSLYGPAVSKCLISLSCHLPALTLSTLLSNGFLPLLFEHSDANTVRLLTNFARQGSSEEREALLREGLLRYLLTAPGRGQKDVIVDALETALLLLRSHGSGSSGSVSASESISLLKRKLLPTATDGQLQLLDQILAELS